MPDNYKSTDRPWQEIAAEMNVEQDTKKLLQLAKELDQAMLNEERETVRKRLGLDKRTLCERAGNEQDLARRIELVREINRLLIEGLLQEKDRLNLIPYHRSPTLRRDE